MTIAQHIKIKTAKKIKRFIPKKLDNQSYEQFRKTLIDKIDSICYKK